MRVLILGGTGMLGHKLWQHLSRRFPETHVTVRMPRNTYARSGLFDDARVIDNVDVEDFGNLEPVLQRVAPTVLVNCVAVTKRRDEAADVVTNIILNALLPHQLVKWAAAREARVISFSTDCVFSGTRGGYTEQDATDAQDLYGRTKALGEIAASNALTLRSSFIGRELAYGTELLEWLLAQRGKTVKGYRQALYSGVTNVYLAALVGDIIAKFPHLSGLYQVASEVITKYDLLALARDILHLNVTIEPDDSVVIKRDLNGEKFRLATGCVPPSWRTMLEQVAADPTPYALWRG